MEAVATSRGLPTYARLSWEADVQVSTAIQDYFGSGTCEAIYCDCVPILPNRLNYPTFIPEGHRAMCLYEDDRGQFETLEWACQNVNEIRSVSFRATVESFDWGRMIGQHDHLLTKILEGQAR